MTTHPGLWIRPLLVGSLLFAAPFSAGAQVQVPIPGVTGSLGLSSSIDKFYSDVNMLLEKTGEGLGHVVRKTDDTTDRASARSLEGLQPGTPVVVQYTVKGVPTSADPANESTVTRVDRDRKRITVTFRDGGTETLRLAEHGPFSEDHPRSRVVVYHRDASGRNVAAYFKQVGR
jgi:hypothetical protein